ncbi:MAG: hypothetical protein HYX51_08535 [Chloroflexi bacterium]|nr:hypothetical protein [Chloroflexota bacterium]
MDDELEQVLRGVLAGERFGVLATSAHGRLHTATILFAETQAWELIHAIRPATLKAHHASVSPDVAFQVDNRATVAEDRSGFIRAGFEGTLRRVQPGDPSWEDYHTAFSNKLPFGAALLSSPEIALYVLTPSVVRVAIGAQPPRDIAITAPEMQGSWA